LGAGIELERWLVAGLGIEAPIHLSMNAAIQHERDARPAMNEGDLCARHYATGKPVRVIWQNGHIHAVLNANQPMPPDLWIAPALVDLQVNGFGGIDFQQDNAPLSGLVTASRRLHAAGCGRYLLTLITDEWPRLIARLRHLRELRQRSAELRHAIAGWHIEGPFLSSEPGFCGAHDPVLMIDPTPDHLRELREATGDDLVLLTIAPERTNALAAIEQAVALGMKVSLGHTNASADLIAEAVQRGATGFTHLGNGCPRELDRHDNILWRVLETRGLRVSLIPDTIHVSPALFRIAHHELERRAPARPIETHPVRAEREPGAPIPFHGPAPSPMSDIETHDKLGADSIYYISDAMAAAGMKPGRYQLGRLELEVGADQIVRLPGKPNFAGSALRPIDGVFRAAKMLGCSWREAWPRFSEVPAKWMSLPCGLAPGNPADFCLLTVTPQNQLKTLKVFVNGEAAE
jgi:N-acetylglucosamine-6-phosphate deacetylase